MTNLEFLYYLEDCAEELPDDNTGQFTGGIYSRTFQLGNVIYTVLIDDSYPQWVDITKKFI